MEKLTQHRWVQGWHINACGDLFGGQLLSWSDEDTMMLAHLNSHHDSLYVTRGMEKVNFKAPARQGDRLCFSHQIVYLGKTSLWTWTDVVNVEGETVFNCYTSLVAIDTFGKPKLIDDYLNDNVRESVPRDEFWNYVELLRSI